MFVESLICENTKEPFAFFPSRNNYVISSDKWVDGTRLILNYEREKREWMSRGETKSLLPNIGFGPVIQLMPSFLRCPGRYITCNIFGLEVNCVDNVHWRIRNGAAFRERKGLKRIESIQTRHVEYQFYCAFMWSKKF